MKIVTFILACAIVAGVLLLSGCSPVYVDRKVLVPVTKPCHVHLPVLHSLPSKAPIPEGMTPEEKRRWILSAMYRDIVLLQGELVATQTAAKGCE